MTIIKLNLILNTCVLLIYYQTNLKMYAIQLFLQKFATMTVLWLLDSSSLTNEKDHHYFLNSADVCW